MASIGALSLHRFNWMGADHSESSVEVLNLLRADTDAAKSNAMKYKNLESRRRAASQIRAHLAKIKREMALQAQGLDPNTSEATLRAAGETTQLIRGARFRQGGQLVSYIDGSLHEHLGDLRRFNRHARQRLEAVARASAEAIELPDAAAFAGDELDAGAMRLRGAEEALADARLRLQREQEQEAAATAEKKKKEEEEEEKRAKEAAEREADGEQPAQDEGEQATQPPAADGAPPEEPSEEKEADQDEVAREAAAPRGIEAEVADRERAVREAAAAVGDLRTAFNTRALHAARYLFTFASVRHAKLAEGFDPHGTDA